MALIRDALAGGAALQQRSTNHQNLSLLSGSLRNGAAKQDTEESTKRYTAVLLCGGRGTRLHDVTADLIPKPLYRIGGKKNGKSLIHFSVNDMQVSAVDQIVFAVGHKQEMIMHWAKSSHLGVDFSFSNQTIPGIAGAVLSAAELAKNERLVVCCTDEIRQNFSMSDIIAWHEASNAIATAPVTDPRNSSGNSLLYRVEGSNQRVLDTISPGDPRAERIGEGWHQHVGIFVLEKEALPLLRTEKTDWQGGMSDPLVEAGALSAFIRPDIHYVNLNSPDDIHIAHEYLGLMARR